VATSASTSERDDIWWEAVDLVANKSWFLPETISQNLVSLIKIIKLPSAEACRTISQLLVKSIDFLHADGAYPEAQALADVTNRSKLVASGGMIVLDDITGQGFAGRTSSWPADSSGLRESGAMGPPSPRIGSDDNAGLHVSLRWMSYRAETR
jgi:hypothetical protein